MSNGDVMAPVFWHEGMLLTAHHFQQQELFRERAFAFAMKARFPFAYGFLTYNVDTGALPAGVFRFSECEAVLPDGACVTTRDAANALERHLEPLREEMRKSRKPLLLYLGVPDIRTDSAAVGAPGEKIVPPPRFLHHERKVFDIARPDQQTETTINCLRLNARILVNDVEREGHTVIPCARLKYERDAFVIDEKWIPPLIRVSKLSSLWEMLDRFVGEIRQTIRTLTPGAQPIRGGQPLELRAVASTLGAGAAGLEALLSCEAPPGAYYVELSRLLGAMCGLPASAGLEPQKPPEYRHEDLSALFSSLLDMIRALFPVRCAVEKLPFTLEGDRYVIAFKPEWQNRDLFLAARGADAADLVKWVDRAVVCSPRKFDDHWRARDRGIPRRHTPIPSPEIEIKAEGAAVFALSLKECREQVVRSIVEEQALIVREGRFQEKEAVPPRPDELALLIPESPDA